MVTKNFKALLNMMLQSNATAVGCLPIVDVNGVFAYLAGTFSSFPGTRTTTLTTNATAAGISLGSGTTTPTESDYNLEQTITSGISLSLSATSAGVDTPGNPYLLYTITVTNTGSSDVTISEIGYKQTVKGTQFPDSGGGKDIIVLIDRTVLTTPLTIGPGDAGIIDYKLVTVPANSGTVVSGITMVSFDSGTDEQIAAMLDAAQQGTINLQTDGGWQVGNARKISISAFTGGNSVSCPAQDVWIVISSFDEYNGCGNVIQFDFATALSEKFRMNSSNTTTGGYGATEMYTTTLPALVNALPSWMQSRLKTFSVLASAGGSSLTTIETVTGNKLALRASVEVFGAGANGQLGEGSLLPYYNAEASRLKRLGSGTANAWWLRSAYSSTSFCAVNNTGAAGNYFASSAYGVAPFGCI